MQKRNHTNETEKNWMDWGRLRKQMAIPASDWRLSSFTHSLALLLNTCRLAMEQGSLRREPIVYYVIPCHLKVLQVADIPQNKNAIRMLKANVSVQADGQEQWSFLKRSSSNFAFNFNIDSSIDANSSSLITTCLNLLRVSLLEANLFPVLTCKQ